ncbi:MAG: glycosyl transferase [Syntrophobacteraceae bacterium CG23_combo_of_CG06-09_8_20_14_all_50_8]|nr:MAG: glycosyl transferase [Syntrophobacteraceae bacterium CG23_combo_of_CG06-09_8_20_14_all_50_8]
MDWTYLTLTGAVVWFGILILPWRPWGAGEVLDADTSSTDEDFSDITVIIPARNEAGLIASTLSALEIQGKRLAIVMVDDQSTDGTSQIARQTTRQYLRIIRGKPLPAGWTGKLWALEQGVGHVQTPLTLLLDADIELRPGILSALRKKMIENGLQFISLMVALRMKNFWECLLMPAFIYFFKLLYPFRLSNSNFSRVAAAAGGCILLETCLLDAVGGFQALRGELIDDCALAKRVKLQGYRTWIGITHSARSLRPYNHLGEIWNMVARSAFAQLHYSFLLLLLCTAIMITAFWLPVMGLFFPVTMAKAISVASLGAMMLSYLPTLKFYGVPKIFAAAMPLIGTFYLAMTWTSAIRFWLKEGAEWKGRFYIKK